MSGVGPVDPEGRVSPTGCPQVVSRRTALGSRLEAARNAADRLREGVSSLSTIGEKFVFHYQGRWLDALRTVNRGTCAHRDGKIPERESRRSPRKGCRESPCG